MPDYIFGMRMYIRFISANPLCFTLIINPALSSSFKERLTVLTPGEYNGKLLDRKIYKQDSVLVLYSFCEHCIQHPAAHHLCRAADWKLNQCFWEWHTEQRRSGFHKFIFHFSVKWSSFFVTLTRKSFVGSIPASFFQMQSDN